MTLRERCEALILTLRERDSHGMCSCCGVAADRLQAVLDADAGPKYEPGWLASEPPAPDPRWPKPVIPDGPG